MRDATTNATNFSHFSISKIAQNLHQSRHAHNQEVDVEKTKKEEIGNCIFLSIQFREKFSGKLGAVVHFSQNTLFRQVQFIH